MSNKEKKEANISVRCSQKEKAMIERKAKAKGKSTSAYMTDCSLAGLERKSDRNRKNITKMIVYQAKLNSLAEDLRSNQMEVSRADMLGVIKELMEGEIKLWEN